MNKMGLHINKLTPQTKAQALAVPWSVVKFMEFDSAFFAQLKQANPNVIIVGRNYYGDQSSFDANVACAPIIGQSPDVLKHIDYWETYNEVSAAPDDLAKWQQINNFYKSVANILHQHGLKSCALSLGEGNPAGTPDQIKAILNIIWESVSVSDAWSYHAYGAPDLTTNASWFELRYRMYIQLDPRYATKKLILSEFGIDFGAVNLSGGWLRHNITAPQYADEIVAFNKEINNDPYVIGAAIYQAGDTSDPLSYLDGSKTWGSFLVTDELVFQIKTKLESEVVVTPANPVTVDPDLAYFQMYGIIINPDSALYKYALLTLRSLYKELLAAGRIREANLVNPGPALSAEQQIVKDGVIHYQMKLTNRIVEVYNLNGVWNAGQVELFK